MQSGISVAMLHRGIRLATAGLLFTLLLIPLRTCTALVAVRPSFWDVLLRPETAGNLALFFGLVGLLLAALVSTRDNAAIQWTHAVMHAGILAIVMVLCSYHNANNGVLQRLDRSEGTNEAVLVSGEVGGLPTPYTLPGSEDFWGAARQVQEVRATQFDYPAVAGEPFSTVYAEIAQSSLGAGDLGRAQAASSRLLKLAPDSHVALLVAAKVSYAAGDVSQSLRLTTRALDDADSESVARWLRAVQAYYRAAESASDGANRDATHSLVEYARLSFDPFVLDRVEADPSFDGFVNTAEVEELARSLEEVPTVDRNDSDD